MQTPKLKIHLTIAFYTAMLHNYDANQRTPEKQTETNKAGQNPPITNHECDL